MGPGRRQPYVVKDGAALVPNDIARGGWGPTLGGQVVGGILAREVEAQRADAELVPARFTVDILRRVALAPVLVKAESTRVGKRMQSVDAVLTQDGDKVARATTLLLRRGEHPQESPWSLPVPMPAPPDEPREIDDAAPMFITPYSDGVTTPGEIAWKADAPRQAWVREIRCLVDDEPLTPFVRAAMAVDVTASMTGFSKTGLSFINADYTLTLCRLPEGPWLGLAGLTYYSANGIGIGAASLFDAAGPIGTGVTTAAANPSFRGTG